MRILIVDDDTSVIQTLLATLKTLPGHDVRVATSGDKAIENGMAMGGVDLLITDVVMEPMDGFTLRDQIITRYPHVRTILISGYDLSDYPEQTEHHQLLQKPFDPPTLIAAVQREIAAAAATPVAVRATGVPQPRAAIPTAVPAGRATAVPMGIPQPRAVPAAQPAARATAAPAAPVAKTVPAAQPRAVVPNSAPIAVAPAPRAVVAQAPVPLSPFAVAPTPATPEGAGESLIGQMIGAYQIVSYLGEGRLGSAYAAVQISINRPVGLKVLDPSRAQDESVKARFIADARAKAHVQHPAILAVYEAGESAGRIFYAREYVDGQSLQEIATNRQALDDNTALKIIRVVAEGFVYLTSHNIPHRHLEPSKVFLGMDGQPRLANLAVQVADESFSTEQEIQMLGQIMIHVVPGAQILSPTMNALLNRMTQPGGFSAWGQVIQAVKALEPKVVPVEAARITAQDQAAIKAVEAARKQQRKAFWINVISLTTLFSIVVFIALRKFVFTNERSVQATVKIPAGSYTLFGGKQVVIERDYWIDKYEVTWGQYARFLEYLDKNPTRDQDFRHPRMPRHLLHDNEDARIYVARARAGKPARGVPTDLNSPVITVTWWDAYAYAKWLGAQTGTDRDLPTEEEWEVAAAGTKGDKFPWGSGDASGVNTGADHDMKRLGSDPKNGWKGDVDGYNMWASVDALSGDRSPTGVYGLGGNVAEWTATWTADNRFPIIKGGSFITKDPKPISYRNDNHDPGKVEDWLGFRTISRTPPPDAE
jgi:formylglycine-generating enzyme required for sulfatase activity/CheY-like chemotaxis protein